MSNNKKGIKHLEKSDLFWGRGKGGFGTLWLREKKVGHSLLILKILTGLLHCGLILICLPTWTSKLLESFLDKLHLGSIQNLPGRICSFYLSSTTIWISQDRTRNSSSRFKPKCSPSELHQIWNHFLDICFSWHLASTPNLPRRICTIWSILHH